MEEEMAAHARNGTWLLVDRPDGELILANMWVCKVKLDVNGRPERYKCRVVAKGFMQVPGVHFHERHAPTLRGECLRGLLITAALEDLELQQRVRVRAAPLLPSALVAVLSFRPPRS